MKRRLTALLLVLLCLPLTACQKQQNLYSATWFDLFDTVAIVQGYADSQDSWNAQTQAMYSDLQRYNELFDIYHHYDGVINLYDVNARAAAAPVQVSDELYAFLRWCKDTAYPAANGATNIAAGAVLRLWHDARESDSPAPPDADAIAVFMHWGQEYATSPSAQQRELADFLFENGATLVLGGHVHVPQPMELRELPYGRTGFLCYCLGNLISNQHDRYTNLTAAVSLELTKDGETGAVTVSDAEYVPRYMLHPDASAGGRYHLLDLNRSIADCESGDHTVVPAAVLPALRQGLADAHSIFGAEEELQLSPAEKAA